MIPPSLMYQVLYLFSRKLIHEHTISPTIKLDATFLNQTPQPSIATTTTEPTQMKWFRMRVRERHRLSENHHCCELSLAYRRHQSRFRPSPTQIWPQRKASVNQQSDPRSQRDDEGFWWIKWKNETVILIILFSGFYVFNDGEDDEHEGGRRWRLMSFYFYLILSI